MALEHISTKAFVKGGVRKDFAWRMIADFGNYPAQGRPIQKVVVHERSAREGKSEWFLSLEDAPVRWMEKDYFDAENFGISFESVDGDFEHINGCWKVEDHNGEGIELGYRFDYDLGIPVIEENVGPILKAKMQTNIDTIVQSLAARLHGASVEERALPRIAIGCYNTMSLDGKSIRAKIINIGKRGMMFDYGVAPQSREVSLCIDDMALQAELYPIGPSGERVRAVFQKEMSSEDLQHCVQFFTTKNQRSHDRKMVRKNSVVRSSGKTVLAHIIDVSPSGMLIECFDSIEIIDATLEVSGMALAPRKKLFDADQKTLRVQFAQTFNEVDFSNFIAKLETPRSKVTEIQLV